MWTDKQNCEKIDAFCALSPIIPVVAINTTEDALPLAHALLEGGINVIEITLRTENALKSMAAIAKELPDMHIAAGTVINPNQYQQAIDAGAKYIISPGITSNLLEKGQHNDIPLLPGVSSASELMQAIEMGYQRFKFFPAEAAGSIAMLNALSGPFPQVKFCPTGGITPDNANHFLALKNVMCVGGSWLSPKQVIEDKNWPLITKIAKESLNRCP